MSTPPAPAAEATLRILAFLARQRGPVAASTIVTALGLPRSRVYQLLTLLAEHGFALHLPEQRRWALGHAASELGSGFTRSTPLASLGSPLLARLVARVGESAHLAVLAGSDVVYIVEQRAPRRPSLVTDVGVRLPSHVTASGRAILAWLPRKQVLALYPSSASLAGLGNAAPGSLSAFRTLLAETRRRGWAVEDGDVTEGLASVAAPVLDHTGWPVAAVAITYPTHPLGDAAPDVAMLVEEAEAAASSLTRAIGGRAAGSGG